MSHSPSKSSWSDYLFSPSKLIDDLEEEAASLYQQGISLYDEGTSLIEKTKEVIEQKIVDLLPAPVARAYRHYHDHSFGEMANEGVSWAKDQACSFYKEHQKAIDRALQVVGGKALADSIAHYLAPPTEPTEGVAKAIVNQPREVFPLPQEVTANVPTPSTPIPLPVLALNETPENQRTSRIVREKNASADSPLPLLPVFDVLTSWGSSVIASTDTASVGTASAVIETPKESASPSPSSVILPSVVEMAMLVSSEMGEQILTVGLGLLLHPVAVLSQDSSEVQESGALTVFAQTSFLGLSTVFVSSVTESSAPVFVNSDSVALASIDLASQLPFFGLFLSVGGRRMSSENKNVVLAGSAGTDGSFRKVASSGATISLEIFLSHSSAVGGEIEEARALGTTLGENPGIIAVAGSGAFSTVQVRSGTGDVPSDTTSASSAKFSQIENAIAAVLTNAQRPVNYSAPSSAVKTHGDPISNSSDTHRTVGSLDASLNRVGDRGEQGNGSDTDHRGRRYSDEIYYEGLASEGLALTANSLGESPLNDSRKNDILFPSVGERKPASDSAFA